MKKAIIFPRIFFIDTWLLLLLFCNTAASFSINLFTISGRHNDRNFLPYHLGAYPSNANSQQVISKTSPSPTKSIEIVEKSSSKPSKKFKSAFNYSYPNDNKSFANRNSINLDPHSLSNGTTITTNNIDSELVPSFIDDVSNASDIFDSVHSELEEVHAQINGEQAMTAPETLTTKTFNSSVDKNDPNIYNVSSTITETNTSTTTSTDKPIVTSTDEPKTPWDDILDGISTLPMLSTQSPESASINTDSRNNTLESKSSNTSGNVYNLPSAISSFTNETQNYFGNLMKNIYSWSSPRPSSTYLSRGKAQPSKPKQKAPASDPLSSITNFFTPGNDSSKIEQETELDKIVDFDDDNDIETISQTPSSKNRFTSFFDRLNPMSWFSTSSTKATSNFTTTGKANKTSRSTGSINETIQSTLPKNGTTNSTKLTSSLKSLLSHEPDTATLSKSRNDSALRNDSSSRKDLMVFPPMFTSSLEQPKKSAAKMSSESSSPLKTSTDILLDKPSIKPIKLNKRLTDPLTLEDLESILVNNRFVRKSELDVALQEQKILAERQAQTSVSSSSKTSSKKVKKNNNNTEEETVTTEQSKSSTKSVTAPKGIAFPQASILSFDILKWGSSVAAGICGTILGISILPNFWLMGCIAGGIYGHEVGRRVSMDDKPPTGPDLLVVSLGKRLATLYLKVYDLLNTLFFMYKTGQLSYEYFKRYQKLDERFGIQTKMDAWNARFAEGKEAFDKWERENEVGRKILAGLRTFWLVEERSLNKAMARKRRRSKYRPVQFIYDVAHYVEAFLRSLWKAISGGGDEELRDFFRELRINLSERRGDDLGTHVGSAIVSVIFATFISKLFSVSSFYLNVIAIAVSLVYPDWFLYFRRRSSTTKDSASYGGNAKSSNADRTKYHYYVRRNGEKRYYRTGNPLYGLTDVKKKEDKAKWPWVKPSDKPLKRRRFFGGRNKRDRNELEQQLE